MAQKRMFDKRITDSDKFMDLPNSTKALYFMAGMTADDRGFFQPRRLQKLCGFTDDDYKVLIAKGYLIPFESGVMVITDWNKNNYLDRNRITETEYIQELKLLKIINEKYELNNSRLTSVKQVFNQYSIEENSIEENSIEENSIDIYSPAKQDKIPYKEIVDYLNFKINSNYKPTTKKTKDLIKARYNEGFKLEDFKKVIDKKVNEWINDKKMEQFLRPTTLFGTNFESYLNQPEKKRTLKDISLKELEEMNNATNRVYSTNENIGNELW